MTDPLTIRERTKYQKMWTFPQYRATHCHEHAEKFLVSESIPPRATIIDFGCGGGEASRVFHDHGLKVTAIDLAENALLAVNIGLFEFRQECLWALPTDLEPADYGFCADTMEHIPPAKVDAVLAAIAKRVRGPVFFNISLRRDYSGELINDVLHLTVRPATWWRQKLRRQWANVEIAVAGAEMNATCAGRLSWMGRAATYLRDVFG